MTQPDIAFHLPTRLLPLLGARTVVVSLISFALLTIVNTDESVLLRRVVRCFRDSCYPQPVPKCSLKWLLLLKPPNHVCHLAFIMLNVSGPPPIVVWFVGRRRDMRVDPPIQVRISRSLSIKTYSWRRSSQIGKKSSVAAKNLQRVAHSDVNVKAPQRAERA